MTASATQQVRIERRSFDPLWLAWACFACAVLARVWWRLNPLKFNPINGDFQTFNAASRLLEGQVPFVDFWPYLGLGPSYMTATALGALGGDFRASVIGAEILSACAFLLIAWTVLSRAQARRPVECAIGLYLITALAVTVLYGASWFPLKMMGALLLSLLGMATTSLINPGHSLLVLRAVWPFLLVPVLMWALRVPSASRGAVLGGLLGAGVLWSPDYGATTAVGFLLAGALSRKWGASTMLVAVSMLCFGAALAIFSVTHGHPEAWLRFVSSVDEYQSWYYLDEVHKALSIRNLFEDDIAFINLLIIALCAGAAGWLAISLFKNPSEHLAATCAVLMTALLAGMLTSIRSAFLPYYMSPAATVVLCLGLAHFSQSRWLFLQKIGRAWTGGIAVAIVAIVWSVSQIPFIRAEGPAQRRLGVALHPEMNDFEAFVKYVSDRTDRPWSTYATGLEAAMGIHHPSGTDYIIHALGTQGRTEYLRRFSQEALAFPVVVTPRIQAVEWEMWSRRANFDFYRVLLRDYEPRANFSHWTVWERRPAPAMVPAGECRLEQRSEDQVVIRIEQGPAGRLVDLALSYSAEWKDGARQSGGIARLVTATDSALQARHRTSSVAGSYGQPSAATGRHLPLVTDAIGAGEIVLSAHPRGLVTLHVVDCKATAIANAESFEK